MRKTARLDQILLRLGFVGEDQITRGLKRQKTYGGRLGMNLVELGALTEEQLVEALAEQFRVPVLVPEESNIKRELVERMPQDVVAEGLVLPLSWNEEQRVLSLAAANPGDREVMERVRDAFQAKAVRVALAPERRLQEIAHTFAPAAEAPEQGKRRIALPELFAPEPAEPEGEAPASEGESGALRPVLMVTAQPSRKNFLPPLFEREGYALTVAATCDEARAALEGGEFRRVLVAKDMAREYGRWIREEGLPAPDAEVTVFAGVSHGLLDNPLPYEVTVHSLRSSVQALADYRCAALGASPPYGLVAADVQALGERHGLRRIAVDGLHLAVHLLLPAPLPAGEDPVGQAEPFDAFASSLELASRIRFPWKLDRLLAACHALYTGRADPAGAGEFRGETLLAAQILAMAWYRHNHVDGLSGSEEERMITLRTRLREKGGRLGTPDLIEGYLRLIHERGGPVEDLGERQVLLVGGERISRALTPALTRVGREALVTDDLADAQTVAERRPPGAIVVDHAEFPNEVEKFTRVAKLGGASLLFVLTDSTDPSLVLNLLDVGVDDVFGPPHEFDLVAARINRAIRSRSRDRAAEKPQAGQFSATFEVFGFLDLIQMLSQGLKTVRIDLSRGRDERAVIYMQKGRMTHAVCGDLVGEPAVYRVISWQDDGDFTVREETRFPPDTIESSTESVLMEGCRLLDEAGRAEVGG